MRAILFALIVLVSSTAQAGDVLTWWHEQQQQMTVEKHSKADEPVDTRDLPTPPLPPHIALKTLRGDDYVLWALMWNAYHDEVARRGSKETMFYGSTTTTRQTRDGSVTTTVPRFWTKRESVPGVIRYNPFCPPK